jgi:DNA-binding MarR family transcriptional regulator
MDPADKPEEPRALAALMRAARHTYALAMRRPLLEAGADDLPRDGVYAMLAVANANLSAGELGRWLGLSKQAVSQLIDALVLRGYVHRLTDPDDRRRMKLALTERGGQVASICRTAIADVERRILDTVGERRVEHARATLMAIIKLRTQG